jgi:hypothetical protein
MTFFSGVIDSLTNFIEHPEVVADRIERVTEWSATPRVLSPVPIAALRLQRVGDVLPKTSYGRSLRPCVTVPALHPSACSVDSGEAAFNYMAGHGNDAKARCRALRTIFIQLDDFCGGRGRDGWSAGLYRGEFT